MAKSDKATTLAERVVVVTGATSGIGAAAVAALACEAAGVAAFGRRTKASPGSRDNVLAVAGDINSVSDVKALLEQAVARFGRIDALVNCAGVYPKGKFLDIGHEDWRSGIETNLLGYALVCRRILPLMMAQGHGRIVNMGTRLAWECGDHGSSYSCSKAGASMLTRCIASEIDRNRFPDILVNDLIPGPTRTEMNDVGQAPEAVVPYIRDLLLLPEGGATGRTFFRGVEYKPGRDGLVSRIIRKFGS